MIVAMKTTRRHRQIVSAVQRQVRAYYRTGQQARIYHGHTNSTRQALQGLPAVDISRLNRIIELNQAKRYVIVEPNVPLDKLLTATLKVELMPPEVSEFKGITVGGAILGGAGESSSFKYGCFHEDCLEYEIVLGNGQKLTLSAEQNADLFRGVASSCGSLGVITLVKLRLVPTTKFIRLEYHRVNSFEAAHKLIMTKTKEKIDFIDGILFSKTSGLVLVGYYDETPQRPQAKFLGFKDEWFYLHAQKIANNHAFYEESIPIRDYLFRYDRGAFWVGRFGCDYLHLPFKRWVRVVFAPLCTTRRLYRFLHGAGLSQRYFVQDICMPEQNIEQFLQFIDKTLKVYPLWLCPLKAESKYPLSPNNLKTKLVINVGVWNKLDVPYNEYLRLNRQLESQVLDLGGRKVLYAHYYYPEKDFWEIYSRSSYEKLRTKYHANTTFPDVYRKTFVDRVYPEPVIAKGWLALIRRPFH